MDAQLLLEVVHCAATFIVEGPTGAVCRATLKHCPPDGSKDQGEAVAD